MVLDVGSVSLNQCLAKYREGIAVILASCMVCNSVVLQFVLPRSPLLLFRQRKAVRLLDPVKQFFVQIRGAADDKMCCPPSGIRFGLQNSLSSRSAFLFTHLWCRSLITHIEQHFDFVIRCASVQGSGDPVVLAHVICREESGLSPQGPNENRVAFEIDYIQWFLSLQSQLVFGHIHDEGEPLPIAAMPEHLMIRRFAPRIIRLCIVCFHDEGS